MPFTRLQPYDWPQDKLTVPDGFGGMPPVEFGNRNLVGDEFFALSAQFSFPAATAAFTIRNAILETPQDGDFWCNEIGVVSWEADPIGHPDGDTQGFLASMVTIKDIRTGRNLIYNPPFIPFGQTRQLWPENAVPINLFRKLPQSGTEVGTSYDGSTPAPSGFRTTGTLIQPFCFTRQGGIAISVTNLFAAPAGIDFDVTLGFNGWKAYADASR